MCASIADSIASRESIMAPRSDSSASMLWGGTRAALRDRTSSTDWTTCPLSYSPVAHDTWLSENNDLSGLWGDSGVTL